MKQKGFTAFTRDVPGAVIRRQRPTAEKYEVLPSGGQGREKKPSAAMARFERICRDALLEAKVDRAAELLARITAARSRPIPDAEGAGPSPWELMNGPVLSAGEIEAQRAAAIDQARLCAESEAAYAARNPHKKAERSLYKNEDKVTLPQERFIDAAPGTSFASLCRASEAAYAARNPHRREGAAT